MEEFLKVGFDDFYIDASCDFCESLVSIREPGDSFFLTDHDMKC